jgi:uncharacterized protein YbaR (Trm112 family)
MIDEDLLKLLVCPLGKAALRVEGNRLVCTRCGPQFTIVDEIPNMLIEEATLPEGCGAISELACVREGDARIDLGNQ